MNSVEALVRSTLRVSFRRPRVARYFWLSYLYLAPFAGIDPIIGSPPPDVMLFTPFTGLTSLPALVLGYSTAALPCPLRLLCDAYISGFGLLRLVPTAISIGLRFVFPFGYLHRLHYDSMTTCSVLFLVEFPLLARHPWVSYCSLPSPALPVSRLSLIHI